MNRTIMMVLVALLYAVPAAGLFNSIDDVQAPRADVLALVRADELQAPVRSDEIQAPRHGGEPHPGEIQAPRAVEAA